MPAKEFICPDGHHVRISECLKHCPLSERCMFLPTLKIIAQSLNRGLTMPTVTELIAGVRETYLKKTTDYAVNPRDVLYALNGQAIHSLHEQNVGENIMSEVRLEDDITSGKFDLYGNLLDNEAGVLGDLKVTSSYKLMKALGIYKIRVPTGEVYKTGAKKGEPKYRFELRYDGVHFVMEWALQLNYYRMLLERHGFQVNKMYIQAICRDSGLRIASERGIDKNLYIIPIHRISDRWLTRYFKHKATILQNSMETNRLPEKCSCSECWHGRKCQAYCDVRSECEAREERDLDERVG